MKNRILKKKLLLFTLFTVIILLVFNYIHPWYLKNQVPANDFYEIRISKTFFEGNDFSEKKIIVTNKAKIDELYNYLFNRKCTKVNMWFKNFYTFDGQDFSIYFIGKKNILNVSLLEPDYIIIERDPYFIDDDFNFDTFINIYKEE